MAAATAWATVYSINTDGNGFQLLHHFGGQVGGFDDGYAPFGSLVLSGSTLYGLTGAGGTNGISEGVVFSMGLDGGNYQILHSFIGEGQGPQGSPALFGTTLYGMTGSTIWQINTDGSGFLALHTFTGTTNDGGLALGSLTLSGGYLYGMTSTGGLNDVGTLFKFNPVGSVFQILHNFATDEAWNPHGDLAISGSTLYGMSYGGVTNYKNLNIGSGAVFQINTDGSDYQRIHTFLFPIDATDGSLPFGGPMLAGTTLYGMTSIGGSEAHDEGCIFALTVSPSTVTSSTPPTISTTPLAMGTIDVAYKYQLEATGGTPPYTWAVSSGHLPKGLTLTAAGLLSGKPTAGVIAEFFVKVTDHKKLSATNYVTLIIIAPPILTITTPKPNQRVTVGQLNAAGTATKGLSPVRAVYFQLNGGAWTEASTANSFATWYYDSLSLLADTNIFSAYALDESGYYSKTNTVKFTYYVTTPLTVTTNGKGTIAPNYNKAKLQVGATYSMTAKPAKGYAFEDWTDGFGNILTNKPALKFMMASNLALTAKFEQSAVAAAVVPGNYQGLFAPKDVVRQNTNSGAMSLAVASSGSFSGTRRYREIQR
jgi:uncharacterized repeat protein (TIGR03803 family)